MPILRPFSGTASFAPSRPDVAAIDIGWTLRGKSPCGSRPDRDPGRCRGCAWSTVLPGADGPSADRPTTGTRYERAQAAQAYMESTAFLEMVAALRAGDAGAVEALLRRYDP